MRRRCGTWDTTARAWWSPGSIRVSMSVIPIWPRTIAAAATRGSIRTASTPPHPPTSPATAQRRWVLLSVAATAVRRSVWLLGPGGSPVASSTTPAHRRLVPFIWRCSGSWTPTAIPIRPTRHWSSTTRGRSVHPAATSSSNQICRRCARQESSRCSQPATLAPVPAPVSARPTIPRHCRWARRRTWTATTPTAAVALRRAAKHRAPTPMSSLLASTSGPPIETVSTRTGPAPRWPRRPSPGRLRCWPAPDRPRRCRQRSRCSTRRSIWALSAPMTPSVEVGSTSPPRTKRW